MTAAVVEKRAVSGAFEEFYRDNWHAATRLAGAVAGDQSAGEDIAQEVFQRLSRVWGTPETPEAYLRVAIVNSCRSYHRRKRTERAKLPRLVPRDGEFEPSGELDDIVSALPENQRKVVRMRYWDGSSEAEIAHAMGCRPGTVKSLAARARDRMAAQLS